MNERARAYQKQAESACWWWPHREFVMVCARPRSIHRDARGRLHNEHGPAIHWPDGWGVYSWHGVRVPSDVIERPETITAARISGEANAEVRRVMLERFGVDRYLVAGNFKQLHKDDWGTLWQEQRTGGEESLTLVQVVNSTPEPDGSWKTYTLMVPPTMRRAREAVAWTFSLNESDYELAQQT